MELIPHPADIVAAINNNVEYLSKVSKDLIILCSAVSILNLVYYFGFIRRLREKEFSTFMFAIMTVDMVVLTAGAITVRVTIDEWNNQSLKQQIDAVVTKERRFQNGLYAGACILVLGVVIGSTLHLINIVKYWTLCWKIEAAFTSKQTFTPSQLNLLAHLFVWIPSLVFFGAFAYQSATFLYQFVYEHLQNNGMNHVDQALLLAPVFWSTSLQLDSVRRLNKIKKITREFKISFNWFTAAGLFLTYLQFIATFTWF